MHLFSQEHLAASSGIVGSSGPLGAGFALAAQYLEPGRIAVSFFGDGAANQGMLMESFNLASAWKLPLVFVCKDNNWAITTTTSSVTGGDLLRRARSFGMPARRVDGKRVEAVWAAADRAVRRARAGRGPSFILARCCRMEGHFLGDPLLRVYEEPVKQTAEIAPPLARAMFSRPLAAVVPRCGNVANIGAVIARLGGERYLRNLDPMRHAANLLAAETRGRIEEEAGREVAEAVAEAMEGRGRHA